MSIANTELPLLCFVQETIGAGKITRKRVTRAHHSASYHYFLSCSQALTLLEQVRPFLRTYKRARADFALERYRSLTPRNGKYSTEQLLARTRFEEDFLRISAASTSPSSGQARPVGLTPRA